MGLPRALDRDLLVVEHPFRAPGGLELGTRSTLVRLPDGRLWMLSPGPLVPPLRAWLEANGPLGVIVAPSLLHHLSLRENAEAFPAASCYGPPGFEAKTGLPVTVLDGHTTPWPDTFDTHLVAGCPKMNELVFLHRASGTLILTDLAFNFRAAEGGFTRLFLRLNDSLGRFGPSRLARFAFFQDGDALARSLRAILAWKFDRIVVAHGEVLERGGQQAMERAFAPWLAR